MPVATICNHKGGTGKTTTVVHVAAALGLGGRRVLVVDLDPQGFLTRTLGVEEPALEASSLALFSAEGDLALLPTHALHGFELLPASYTMTKAMRAMNRPTDVFWVKEALDAPHPYDLVLFDTAAAVSVFTMNALVASRLVVIPVTPEYQPVVGAEQTWDTTRLIRDKLNPDLAEPLFLLTQVDARKRSHTQHAQYIRERYGDRVLHQVVRTSAALAEQARDGRTVFDTDMTSRGAIDYANAADEIAGHLWPEAPSPASPESVPSSPSVPESPEGPAPPVAWTPLGQLG